MTEWMEWASAWATEILVKEKKCRLFRIYSECRHCTWIWVVSTEHIISKIVSNITCVCVWAREFEMVSHIAHCIYKSAATAHSIHLTERIDILAHKTKTKTQQHMGAHIGSGRRQMPMNDIDSATLQSTQCTLRSANGNQTGGNKMPNSTYILIIFLALSVYYFRLLFETIKMSYNFFFWTVIFVFNRLAVKLIESKYKFESFDIAWKLWMTMYTFEGHYRVYMVMDV